MLVFRLRLNGSVRGPGSNPTPTPVTVDDSNILPPGSDSDLDIPGDIAANTTATPANPGAAAENTLRRMGASPQPVEVVEGESPTVNESNRSLGNAIQHLNNARDAFIALEGQSGVDLSNTTREIRNDLDTARNSLREATHPAGQRGVGLNHTVTTDLHPQGVTVAQIQQRLIALEGRLGRMISQTPIAAAAGAVASHNTSTAQMPNHLTPGVPFTITGNHPPTTAVLESVTTTTLESVAYTPGSVSPRESTEQALATSRPDAASQTVTPAARPVARTIDEAMDRAIGPEPTQRLNPTPTAAQATPTAPVVNRPTVQAAPLPPPMPAGVRGDMDLAGQHLTTAEAATQDSARSYYVERANIYVPRAINEFNSYCTQNNMNNDSPILFDGERRTVGQVRADLEALHNRLVTLAPLAPDYVFNPRSNE